MKKTVYFFAVLFLLEGCAGLREARPIKPVRSQPSMTAKPGEPVKEISPTTGVQREVVRLQGPQYAAVRSPQRLASMEIVERGRVAMARREWDKALQSFQEAVTVDGTNGIAYYYLAKTRYELRQPAQAMGLLERAEALLGDSAEWLENVAELRAMIQAAQ